MAFGVLPKDANQVPISSVYVHNAGFIALQGSTLTDTDGSSNQSTPANMNLTQILSAAPSITNGIPVSGSNGTSMVVLPLEALNNLLKASLYGKNTNPGDTAVKVDASGNLTANQGGSNWTMNAAQVAGTTTSVNAGNRDAGTQRYIEAGNPTPTVTQVASAASNTSLLAANANRKGTLFYNDSTATLYLLYGTGAASNTNYSVQIGPQGYYEDPFHYTGGYHGIWSAAQGFVYCTEIA